MIKLRLYYTFFSRKLLRILEPRSSTKNENTLFENRAQDRMVNFEKFALRISNLYTYTHTHIFPYHSSSKFQINGLTIHFNREFLLNHPAPCNPLSNCTRWRKEIIIPKITVVLTLKPKVSPPCEYRIGHTFISPLINPINLGVERIRLETWLETRSIQILIASNSHIQYSFAGKFAR